MSDQNDYSGPVRLQKFRHGTRDLATARAVLANVQQVTPPLVIPWQPHQEKIEKELRHLRVQGLISTALQNLVDTTTRHSMALNQFRHQQLKAIMQSLSEPPEIDHVDD